MIHEGSLALDEVGHYCTKLGSRRLVAHRNVLIPLDGSSLRCALLSMSNIPPAALQIDKCYIVCREVMAEKLTSYSREAGHSVGGQ